MYKKEDFDTLIEKAKEEGFIFPDADQVGNFERLVKISAEKKDLDVVFAADNSKREVPKAVAKIDKASGKICMFPVDSEFAGAVRSSISIRDVRESIKSVIGRRVAHGFVSSRRLSF